ncbi:hypothetical protein [Leptothoe spongobia]|uniref:Uncharacterized protein n=1 Tax=Leptothoe spongobia TAU-MAC 1115 TaxID=1967444 RepID=A0A947DBF2_9CYAN|nr:hypothetical protein [Leptothoe spongobia]MBT9314057.1 hypothetical protein [Leptothoe spongobia TAU-MAC 1115]
MSNFLLVPIQMDALHLKYGTSVAEAMVEFNRLPYFSGKRDVNPDIVNVSESIVSQPFQNKNLHLKAGIHLHWALPDALTKESVSGKFPAVPNRWLVTRRDQDGVDHWIVESDYLHLPSVGFQEDSVTYPYQDETNQDLPRFRYLGRKLPLAEWKNELQESNPDVTYLERLTTVGYGEPTFAAFYPNCRSVFGFHDPKYTDATPLPDKDKLQYEVIGWYSNSSQNYLNEFLKDFNVRYQEDFPEEALTLDTFMDAIKEEFKWKFNWDNEAFTADSEAPQIICYSRLTFRPSEHDLERSSLEKANISLAVANTGTEALSAYLAETIDKSQKAIIEEQLEALQFAESLENQKLDNGPKFQEIRHGGGFNAVAGGFLWRIRLETEQSNSENQVSQTKLNLPSDIAAQLSALNQKQQAYDSALAEINARRRQLFSDWYKYMVSTYPPEDSWDNYPDIDEVKYYIQKQGLEPLQEKVRTTGTLNLFQDDARNLSNASGSDSSLSSELAGAINNLINATNTYNQKLKDDYNKLDAKEKEKVPYPPVYRLEVAGSPRYWEVKEPVVLLVGDDVKANERHGRDGRLSEDGLLECQIIENQTIQSLVQENFKTISDKLDELKLDKGQERIGFSIWERQPWNPIILEWLVELYTVANGGNKTSANRKYSNDFLLQNYNLRTNDIDLSLKSARSVVDDTADNRIKTDQDSNIYSGFSILTPYANPLLQKRIEEYLDKHDHNGQATITNPVYQTISDYAQHLKNQQPRDREIESHLRQSIAPQYVDYEEAVEIDSDEYLGELANIQTLKQWYEDNKFDIIPHPVATAKQAQARLKNLNCLSQAIGGFNEALLMHKQTLQLPIQDPIGFADYQTFTDEVGAAVSGEIKSAPQPLDDFSPIRSGELRIIDLQLMDTFGQVRNLDWRVDLEEYVIKPESMKAEQNNRIVLPPRFVQPCRINFRWLSANDKDNRETNDLSNTTPICGWILPNNLNDSLMIYDNLGQALGSININGEWDDAPGDAPLATTIIEGHDVPNISNVHLHKVVKTIITLGRDFLVNFNRCLNNALNNIDPESFAQNQSLALLMGRPISVVRTSISLELQGLPAINQDWNIFRQEMQQMQSLDERDTDDLDDVKIPIRIGEYRQLNDGVIGYWKEQKNAANETGYDYEHDIFYAQQSDNNESEKIETQFIDLEMNPEVEEGPINIIQSINSDPQTLTMLVDPRGVFHATSGILPSKVINIPAEHYAEALANIKITFLTAPILTERTNQSRLNLPLPTAPDYDWSWLERKGRETWLEILTTSVIEKAVFVQAYAAYKIERDPEEDWQALLNQGWLTLVNGGGEEIHSKAKIITKDDRETLTGNLENIDELIEELFDLHEISINPVTSRAAFTGSQEIREGWLILNQSPDENLGNTDTHSTP